MPATYEKIATTTLGSAAATITFNSIAASWTDLRLVLTSTTSAAGQSIYITFNSTATGYSGTVLTGTGTSATTARYTNEVNFILGQWGSGTSTTIPTFCSADMLSYAGSTFKTCLITENMDKNGSGHVTSQVALWRNTAAITSVILGLSGGNFNSGTTATLYGILKA